MRLLSLKVQSHLGNFSPGEFLGVPAAFLGDPPEADFAVGMDENDGVTDGIQTGLKQEGGVDNDGFYGGIGLGLVDDPVAMLGDDGVDEGLEAPALVGIGEDEIGNFFSVDFAVEGEDVGSPPVGELPDDVGLVEGLSGDVVGIDDGGAEAGELFSDERFAGADAAGEADDRFGLGHGVEVRVCGRGVRRRNHTVGAWGVNGQRCARGDGT